MFYISVLIEVEADIKCDRSVEKCILSQWNAIGRKWYRGERLTESEMEQLNRVRDEMRQRDLEIVNCAPGSIRVWILCRTKGAVGELRKMFTDGRLRDIFNRLFNCLRKRDEHIKMRLKMAPEQFERDKDYFLELGNTILISVFINLCRIVCHMCI